VLSTFVLVIDKGSGEDYYAVSRWTLTTKYAGDTIGDKSDENQDAPLAVETRNYN